MNVPVATSMVRSASASASAAGGGGNTKRKDEEPERNPENSAKEAAEQKNGETAPESAHGGILSDRAFDGEEYALAAVDVTALSPRLAAGGP